jgi:hypothetical protein
LAISGRIWCFRGEIAVPAPARIPFGAIGLGRTTQTSAGWNVPKNDLMAGLQVLIEKDQVALACWKAKQTLWRFGTQRLL